MSISRIASLFQATGGRLMLQSAAIPLLTEDQRILIDPDVQDNDEKASPEERFTESVKKMTQAIDELDYNLTLVANTFYRDGSQLSDEDTLEYRRKHSDTFHVTLREFIGSLDEHLKTPNNSQSDAFLRAFLELKASKAKIDRYYPDADSITSQTLIKALVQIETLKVDQTRLAIVASQPASSKKIVTESLFGNQIFGMRALFGKFHAAMKNEKNADKQAKLATELLKQLTEFNHVVNDLKSASPCTESFMTSIRQALAAEYVSIDSWLQSQHPANLHKILSDIHNTFNAAIDKVMSLKGLNKDTMDIEHEISQFQNDFSKSAIEKISAMIGLKK